MAGEDALLFDNRLGLWGLPFSQGRCCGAQAGALCKQGPEILGDLQEGHVREAEKAFARVRALDKERSRMGQMLRMQVYATSAA